MVDKTQARQIYGNTHPLNMYYGKNEMKSGIVVSAYNSKKSWLCIARTFLMFKVIRKRIDNCMRCDDMLLYLSNYPLFVLCNSF